MFTVVGYVAEVQICIWVTGAGCCYYLSKDRGLRLELLETVQKDWKQYAYTILFHEWGWVEPAISNWHCGRRFGPVVKRKVESHQIMGIAGVKIPRKYVQWRIWLMMATEYSHRRA